MFVESALKIGGDTGVKGVIAAAQHVHKPLVFFVFCRVLHCRVLQNCA